MRRSLVLMSVLAVSTAVLGACDPKPETPAKPATPAPTATAAPSTSPTGSPVGTATPDAKDKKVDGVKKVAKPAATETPKAK